MNKMKEKKKNGRIVVCKSDWRCESISKEWIFSNKTDGPCDVSLITWSLVIIWLLNVIECPFANSRYKGPYKIRCHDHLYFGDS